MTWLPLPQDELRMVQQERTRLQQQLDQLQLQWAVLEGQHSVGGAAKRPLARLPACLPSPSRILQPIR